MQVFHPKAYEVALYISGSKLEIPGEQEFDDWNKVFVALDRLTPQERCNALYADWVMQLSSPGGDAQLQIRSLLLQRGALAANYLAELAQNADDAADGEEAKLTIKYEKPWLTVANNGRKVTSRNLLGLCRFFVHWGRDPNNRIDTLDEKTIGKFGIGFKSCYSVAKEVYVNSWDKDGEFTFRLPIANKDENDSLPKIPQWTKIKNACADIGIRVNLPLEDLGYCTPEFLDNSLSPNIRADGDTASWSRGTLFRFNLHPQGQKRLEERIDDGPNRLYELCPLFLPNLKEITFGENRLNLSETRSLTRDNADLPLKAQRVTLNIKSDGKETNDRFWRLTGDSSDSKWSLAVTADSDFKVRATSPGEGGVHLKQGGAYAFFPLNSVNAYWSPLVHLHIDLPTNLARSEWNEDEAKHIDEQINDAATNFARWLSLKQEIWSSNFNVQALFPQIPTKNQRWAHIFYERFRAAIDNLPIFKTFSNHTVCAKDARALRLFKNTTIRDAANRLEAISKKSSNCVLVWDDTDWALTKASKLEITQTYNSLIEAIENNQEKHLDVAYMLFATEEASSTIIENVSKKIIVTRHDGQTTTLAELLESVGPANLSQEWHDLFKFALSNLPNSTLAQAIFNKQLKGRCRDLQNREDVFEWDQLAERLKTEDDWINGGESFWTQKKPPCNKAHRLIAIQALRTKDATGRWQPITTKWLSDSNPGHCFAGYITKWTVSYNQGEREKIIQQLKAWDLWETYEETIENKLETLNEHILKRLNSELGAMLELLSSEPLLKTLIRLKKDNPAIGALTEKQIQLALRIFLEGKLSDSSHSQDWYLPDQFSATEKAILDWLGYIPAWKWLSANAQQVYRSFDVPMGTVTILPAPLTLDQKQNLAKQILLRAWQLDSPDSPSQEILTDIKDWFTSATGNWEVATATNRRDHIRELLATSDDTVEELARNNGTLEIADIRRLPNKLTKIPALLSACIHFDACKMRIEGVSASQSIAGSQVEAAIRGCERVQAFFNSTPDAEVRYLSPLNFSYVHLQKDIYRISDALYVIDDSTLYVSKAAVGEDQDYKDKLSIYLGYKPGDQEIRELRDANKSAREIYLLYRERFIAVFRKELVEDIGYTKKHILRELLQNTESAYASRVTPTDGIKSFSLTARKSSIVGRHQIEVTHFGRRFNEIDSSGNERDDIGRIVSIGNEDRDQNEEELGRFNKGFKSLFYATDLVMIRSGRYHFGIRDLIFLEPSKPLPNTIEVETTTFDFECNTRDLGVIVGKTDSLSIFTPEYFIFTKQIQQVKLSSEEANREWNISRQTSDDGWIKVDVSDSMERSQSCFKVKHFKTQFSSRKIKCSIAIQIDSLGNPMEVESKNNYLSLTFPTVDKGFGNFYISGDFTVGQGRLGVQLDRLASSILNQCILELLQECKTAIEAGNAETWLAWVNAMSPLALTDEIRQRLSNDYQTPVTTIRLFSDIFLSRVPDGEEMREARELMFPSKVLRDVADMAGDSISTFSTQAWAEENVHKALKKHVSSNLDEITLPDWIDRYLSTRDHEIMTRYLEGMAQNANAAVRTEVQAALQRIRPPEPLPREPSNLEELVSWWNDNKDINPYTTTGAWWKQLCPPNHQGALVTQQDRADTLKAWLESPTSSDGSLVWFRLLSIAALLSAGRRTSELFTFMANNAPFNRIWCARSEAEMNEAMDAAFLALIEEQSGSELARGEYAYIWRRVFYDLRKIYRVIHEFGFAESVLELCHRDSSAIDIIRFMRGGVVEGDPEPWVGILGQTASSTLLFLLRELQRIGLLNEAHKPHCYFISRPVRRAAIQFGIFDEDALNETDLFRLMDLSKDLHEAIEATPAIHAELKGTYDIPFLAYGLNAL